MEYASSKEAQQVDPRHGGMLSGAEDDTSCSCQTKEDEASVLEGKERVMS